MLVGPTQDFEIKHHKKHMLHNMLNVILFKYCRERYFTSFRELYKYASQGNLIFLNSSHHLNPLVSLQIRFGRKRLKDPGLHLSSETHRGPLDPTIGKHRGQ